MSDPTKEEIIGKLVGEADEVRIPLDHDCLMTGRAKGVPQVVRCHACACDDCLRQLLDWATERYVALRNKP